MDIKFDNVTKNFGLITAIKDLSFEVEKGDFVFVVGPSGCGKSTLIKLILNQFKPTSGTIQVDGHDLSKLKGHLDLDQIRKRIGVIFQDFQLISDLNLEENIALNLDIVNFPKEKIPSQIDYVLKKVKLTNRRFLFPRELSGGELQRACLARALSGQPNLILADEPTGNLDPVNAWNLIKIFKEVNSEGTTILMTTHHQDFIDSLGKKVIKLGKIK